MAIIDINIPIEDAVTNGSLNPITSNAVFDALALKANSADLATVATTGDYNDLDNLPVIPAAQVNADWNATSGVAEILNKPTIPSVTGFVPYTGATQDVDLGTHKLTTNDLVVNHPSGSGVGASITKGGAGEALTVVKSSGSGNAASITGGVTLIDELHLTTDLSDTYIASAATWNAKQAALVSGTNIKTVNGNSLLGSGDLVISGGGGSGIFGISNASGVYTYYATLTLAMAAATSGQVIEMFADYTQSTATNIELKDGVNIQGNGHTYTYSAAGTSYALNQTNAGTYNIRILNITILRTTGTGGCFNQFYASDGNMHFDGTVLKSTGGGPSFYSAGGFKYYNLTAISTTSATAIDFWASGIQGTFINCIGINTSSGYGYSIGAGGTLNNCYGESNSGSGIFGNGNFRNCVGKSISGAGIAPSGNMYNCSGFSSTGYGIDSTNATQCVSSVGTSASNLGFFVGGVYTSKCTGISSSGVGMASGTGSVQVYDCDGYSSSYQLLPIL